MRYQNKGISDIVATIDVMLATYQLLLKNEFAAIADKREDVIDADKRN